MAAQTRQPLICAYLVVGEDSLKREAVMRRLRTRIADHGDLSFNADVLSGETATGADIVNACNTMPFASDLRLVHVKDVDKLRKPDADAVAAYLSHPNGSTVLALEGEKLAKNTRLYKAVAALGSKAVIDCTPPKRYELPRQVRSMAVNHGVTFTETAAQKLVELVGEDTVHLDNEIKKIALAHRGSDPVNENEVLSLVAPTAEVKPWEFVDAFSARDLPRCLSYLTRMSSTSPQALIIMCVSRIRELICARMLERRGTPYLLADTLKVPSWRVKNHMTWAHRYEDGELRHAIATARDAEQAMKSGTDADKAFFDWMIEVVKPAR